MSQEYKVYVQHRIREQASQVWLWLEHRHAIIAIAGYAGTLLIESGFIDVVSNAKRMPEDVLDALRTVIATGGQMTAEAARAYVEGLEKSGRLQLETWS